jgi:hypothetical protein
VSLGAKSDTVASARRGGARREEPQPRLLRGHRLGVAAAALALARAVAAAAARDRRRRRAREQRANLAKAPVATEQKRPHVRLEVRHAV